MLPFIKHKHLAFHLAPPRTAHPDVMRRRPTIGDDGADEPNYGAGDAGADMAVSLEQGGEDPFANAWQPGDPSPTPVADAYIHSVDLVDPWEPGAQAPTRRHPDVGFGGDYYKSFGPAQVIAGDMDAAFDGACLGALGK